MSNGSLQPSASVPSGDGSTTAEPDLATFWRDDRNGQYSVTVEVSATIRETIKADSEAEARAILREQIEDEGCDLMASDVTDVRIIHARAEQPMYLVLREGKEWGVSHVQPGDLPREPNSTYEASKYAAPASRASA